MLRTAQLLHAVYGQKVGGDARYACTHAVEHTAQLLQVGLARSIVDRRAPLGQHGRHDYIGRTRNRSLVQKHIGALQPAASDRIELLAGIEVERGAQLLEAEEVGIQTAAADLVASGLGHVAHAEAREQRSDHHDRTAQTAAAVVVIGTAQIVQIDRLGTERVCILRQTLDTHAHGRQQLDELHDVDYVRNIVHHHLFGCQQRCA